VSEKSKRAAEAQAEDQSPEPQTDLIAGIEADASEEAERILAEANKAAEERRSAGRNQAQALIQQAESRAEEQARGIHEQSAFSLRMEQRRMALKLREQAVQEVLQRVRRRLAEMVGTEEYRQLLRAWIVEAAIGLGAPRAAVNVSVAERGQIDEKMLEAAQAQVQTLSGRKVRLSLSEEDPLLAQGVVLKAEDGRVEFNNQVATRMQRLQSEIRKVIQDTIWKKESSGR